MEAVIVQSYERIHRSNLIGMGVMPLQFLAGENAATLGLDGTEVIDIEGMGQGRPGRVKVRASQEDGTSIEFQAQVRVDTPKEWDYYLNGGILHYVLRQLADADRAA